MANIKKYLENIKGALFGKDVRSSIHDGINAINEEVENTTENQKDLRNVFDQLIINAGNSNAEIVEARINHEGKVYNKLKNRLDDTDLELSEVVSNVNIENWYYPKNIKGTVLGTDNIPSSYSHDNYEGFYDWILNPLVNEFSEYVTKTTLGKDSSNLYNIYRYDFTPKNYDRTVVILSNVHGNEYTSFYGICRFLDDLCRKYKTDSNLSFLRRKVKIVVLPIVNPWGFVNSNRRNVNAVDLNRNTSYRWEDYTSINGQAGGKYYKGAKPFSEKESQYVKAIVEEVCNDKFVGFIDLHTLNTIEAEKVLYYPRFAENIISKFANLMSNFDSETNEDRSILSSSAVPTFSNWVAHTYKVNACNPEFSNSVYGATRGDFLMRKHVEWVGNILLTVAKENRKSKTTKNGAFSYMLMWDRSEEASEVEDENRNSNKGHRVLKSDTYNTFYLTQRYIDIPQEGILNINGSVRVYAEKDCTLYLDPLVYQKYSPEQNYNTLSFESRYSEIVRLKAGQEIYIPINAILQGFYTNYNDESSTRADQMQFRLRAKADVSDAVWITGYKVILNFVPSDLGKCVTIERANYSEYETVYPLRIMEDIED